jgi:hypothetical protein
MWREGCSCRVLSEDAALEGGRDTKGSERGEEWVWDVDFVYDAG